MNNKLKAINKIGCEESSLSFTVRTSLVTITYKHHLYGIKINFSFLSQNKREKDIENEKETDQRDSYKM